MLSKLILHVLRGLSAKPEPATFMLTLHGSVDRPHCGAHTEHKQQDHIPSNVYKKSERQHYFVPFNYVGFSHDG